MKRKIPRVRMFNFVRQVADAETDDNSDHGADGVHLTLMFLFSMSGATCLLSTGQCGCRRLNIGGNDVVLATNDADDAVVGENEKHRRYDVMPDKHDHAVCAKHCWSRPLYKSDAPTVNHCRCRPGRDEVTTNTVNPWQDDSCIRHPTPVVVSVDDRVNDLHVALDSDNDQAEDGTVRGNSHDSISVEQEADDPLANY